MNNTGPVTIAIERTPSLTDLAKDVDALQQAASDHAAYSEGQVTRINTALAKEVTDRNDAIVVAKNAEIAARSYADTQEAQTRLGADKALSDRLTALETAVRVRKYAQDIGNGLLTSFTINHKLDTADVVVAVYQKSNLALVTPATVTAVDANNVRLTFLLALAANANRVVVMG